MQLWKKCENPRWFQKSWPLTLQWQSPGFKPVWDFVWRSHPDLELEVTRHIPQQPFTAAVKKVNIKITSWNYSKLFLREPQTLLNWTFWLCFNLSHSWGQDQLLYRHWRHQLTFVKVTRLHYLIKDLLVRKLKSWLFDRWRTGSRIRVQTENSCECCRFRLTCSFSISVLAACFAFPMAHPQ